MAIFFTRTPGSPRLRGFYNSPAEFRRHLEEMLEDATLQGVEKARDKNWPTPYDTGWLAGSIHMIGPDEAPGGIQTQLAIDLDVVPYAIIQEDTNANASRYLFRAAEFSYEVLQRHCRTMQEFEDMLNDGKKGRKPKFGYAGRGDLAGAVSKGRKPLRPRKPRVGRRKVSLYEVSQQAATARRFQRSEDSTTQLLGDTRRAARIRKKGPEYGARLLQRLRRFQNRSR